MKKKLFLLIALFLLVGLYGCAGNTDGTVSTSTFESASSETESDNDADALSELKKENEELSASLSEANEEIEALKTQLSEYGFNSSDLYIEGVYHMDGLLRRLLHVKYVYPDDDRPERDVLILIDFVSASSCEVVFEAEHIYSVCVDEDMAILKADNAVWFFNADEKETKKLMDIPEGQMVSEFTWYSTQGIAGFLYVLQEDTQTAVYYYDILKDSSRKLIESPSETERIVGMQLFETRSWEWEPDFVLFTVYVYGEGGNNENERTYYTLTSETLSDLIQNHKTGQLDAKTQIRPR